MKFKLEKYDLEFDDDIVNYIEEYEDSELAHRMFFAAMNEAVDQNDRADTRKTFVALASMVGKFLKMCGMKSSDDEPLTCEELGAVFSDMLNVFCVVNDVETKLTEP